MLLIVSMHRSGSSLLAGLLSENGFFAGDENRLVPGNKDNLKGYFERKDVVALNEKMLTTEYHNSSFPDFNSFRTNLANFDVDVANLVNDLKQEGVTVLKDPRLSLTLPVWQQSLTELRVVFLFRDPIEVASSLNKRQGYPMLSALALWEFYNREAVKNIEGLDYKSLFFSDLIKNPQEVIREIKDWAAPVSDVSVQDKSSFLDHSLVHNRSTDSEHRILDRSQKKLFSQLLSGELNEIVRSPASMLKTLHLTQEFVARGFKPSTGRLLDDLASESLSKMNETIKEQRDSLKRQGDSLRLQKDTLKERNAQIANQETRLTDMGNMLRERDRRLSERRKLLSERNEQLENQEKRLKNMGALLAERDARLQERRGLLLDKDKKLSNQEKRLLELSKRLKSELRKKETVESELLRQNRAVVRLQRDGEKLSQKLAQIKAKKSYKYMMRIEQIINSRVFRAPSYLNRKINNLGRSIKQKAIKFRQIANNQGLRSALKKASVTAKSIGQEKTSSLKNTEVSARKQMLEGYERVYLASEYAFTQQEFDWAKLVFFPRYYALQLNSVGVAGRKDNELVMESSNYSDMELFEHFLQEGSDLGLSPGPLFSKDYVNAQLVFEEEEPISDFKGWVRSCIGRDILPTPLFNPRFYLSARPSLDGKSDLFLFQHYLRDSLYRDASPHVLFEPLWYKNHHKLVLADYPSVYHYLVEGSYLGWRPSALFPAFSRKFSADLGMSTLEYVLERTEVESVSAKIDADAEYRDLIEKVGIHEPKIYSPKGFRRINIPPYNTPLYPAIEEVRTGLPKKQYQSIVLIPHCRIGGAALVAGVLCQSLVKLYPKENLLLVRTDNDDFMRPDWFPENIDVVNMLDYCPDLPDVFRKKVLLDMLIGLKPSRIINAHSRLGWIVFSEYGDRLSHWTNLYAYTFCYDVDALGRKVGYPVKYVPETLKYLNGLFVDNQFLKDDLIDNNKFTEEQKSVINVLKTPHSDVQNTTENIKSWKLNKNLAPDRRAKVLWAGRFDRQKRFDLVIKLAKELPNIDFLVWGKAMLGEELDERLLPQNIQLNGLFQSIDELPLDDCDCWLYTSQWDGIPTILIELGLRQVPIVASAVWGVNDLIQEGTGWPVKDFLNLEGYKNGVEHFIQNPEVAEARGKALKKLVIEKHSTDQFETNLARVISDDAWRAVQ